MTAQYILGIDPGLSGALAWLTPDGELTIIDMPVHEVKRNGKNKRELATAELALRIWPSRLPSLNFIAFLEKVGAMPKQGVASTFQFGRTVGTIEGILAANQIPVHYAHPRVWKKAMGVREGKDGSRARASELRPQDADQWPLKKHHGRADAVLIALYGQRLLSQEVAA